MSDNSMQNNTAASSSSLNSLKTGKGKHKPQSTMVSVVEEQSNDDDMIHILPLAPSSNKVTANCTSENENNHEEVADKVEKPEKVQETNSVKLLPSVNEEGKKHSLKLEKKSVEQLSNGLASKTDLKLKKTTNPSISSLRAMSIQGNYPTTSSASTTMTKASTRAEYFAAKLHDAIKNDTKNQNDTVETFVYDTATNATTPPTEQENEPTITTTKTENNDPASSSKNTFTSNEDSPSSNQTYDDYFDVKSRSSTGSRKFSRKKPSKIFSDKHSLPELRPSKNEKQNKCDSERLEKSENDTKSVNQLRQITSRLFDNKLLQQRRQSEIDNEFADDSFEEDLDFYESSLSNITSNHDNYISNLNYRKQMIQRNNSNNMNNYDSHDLEYGDEATDYFASHYDTANNGHGYKHNTNTSYLNRQSINGTNFPDYGSIDYDKRKWRRTMYHNSPHDFTSLRAQRLKQIRSFCYSMSLIVLLLFIGFVCGFILATNKELQGLKVVETHNTLVSQEELVFDMVFSAFDPGLMPIKIDTVQLDVFAKTQYIYHTFDGDEHAQSSYDTVLLGSVDTLEIPLYFQGGFLNRKRDTSETQIKIVNPCSFDNPNDDDNDGNKNSTTINDIIVENAMKPIVFTPDPRWLNISRHPFDLIVRGAMMYKLPFSSQNHTVSISYTSYIDPTDEFI